jgi:hypothetical protein
MLLQLKLLGDVMPRYRAGLGPTDFSQRAKQTALCVSRVITLPYLTRPN